MTLWILTEIIEDELQNIIKKITTIEIRYRFGERKESEIDTKYGKLKVKKVVNNGEKYVYLEFEGIKELTKKKQYT